MNGRGTVRAPGRQEIRLPSRPEMTAAGNEATGMHAEGGPERSQSEPAHGGGSSTELHVEEDHVMIDQRFLGCNTPTGYKRTSTSEVWVTCKRLTGPYPFVDETHTHTHTHTSA